jgi:prepilin-type N-terminal cleavage/methylation domain-containing protein
MQMRQGTTLFELLIALTLIGVFASIAAPSLRATLDVLAARAARETAFGLFTRARVMALQHGGAEIEVSATQDRMILRRASGAVEYEHDFAARDVDVSVDGGADPVILRYDAYGIGRMMSRTVRFHARSANAGVTISSFGRVRRW